jgi:hypothetical protein
VFVLVIPTYEFYLLRNIVRHFIAENSGIFRNVINIQFIVIDWIFFGCRNHILNII